MIDYLEQGRGSYCLRFLEKANIFKRVRAITGSDVITGSNLIFH